jgi:hypothetical protein
VWEGREDVSAASVVQTLITAVLSMPECTDDELSLALQRTGVEKECAERAIAFVPMAFARTLLRGATFPEEFEIRDFDSGRSVRGRFRDEPLFVAAEALSDTLGPSNEGVVRIAERSAEMQVAKELLKAGGTASDLGFTEPVLLRIPLPKDRSWWRFW